MSTRAWLAAALATPLLLTACAQQDRSQEPPASNESEQAAPRLDPDALARLDTQLDALADSENRSGFVAILADEDEILHVSEAGYADIETGRPMDVDTVVRIASMTKPVTAVAIMMLVEDGTISLQDPVSDYIPAFAEAEVATSLQVDGSYEIPTEPLARPITIEDLLTHTSGIGYVFDYETNLGALYIDQDIYATEGSLAERMEALADLPLYFQPGERWFYSYANDVLGRVVEVASGQRLEAFMDANIFTPLGMDDTSFFLNESIEPRLATLYTHGDDGTLTAIPAEQDLIRQSQVEAGGAGLFSTASDYIRFGQMLAGGGALGDVRLLEADTVATMATPHVQGERMPERMAAINLGYGYGVGVYAADAPEGVPGHAGDFGWTGYFDTELFVSPSNGLVGVIMSQEQPGPTSGDTTGARTVFRTLAFDALPHRGDG